VHGFFAELIVLGASHDKALRERSRSIFDLANDYLAASDSPADASGRPNPMSTVSMRSPPNRWDSAAHHGPPQGRLRLGTPSNP
jgi:hypothetical protein